MDSIFCARCKRSFSPQDSTAAEHLRHGVDPALIGGAIEFAGSAGSYAFITNNTLQYVRDMQVFSVLQDKFSGSGMFNTPESSLNWIQERLAAGPGGSDAVLRYLEGQGAGEVDAIRAINGSLRGIFFRAEFVKDAAGHINPTTPGFDFHVVNRFTGQVVEHVQVKSNWSTDPGALRQTIRDFLSGEHYSPDITLAGPRELIEQAKEMGVPNRLSVVGDTHGNEVSGRRLQTLVENQDASVAGELTFQGVAERVAGGALIGAGVSLAFSGISTYIAYRQGRISGSDAFRKVGRDASKGAIVGGSLAGLSLVFPPGAIGIGIGVFVGTQLRRLVDVAYGEGAWLEIVSSIGAIEASTQLTATGAVTLASATRSAAEAHRDTIKQLLLIGLQEQSAREDFERLRRFRSGK